MLPTDGLIPAHAGSTRTRCSWRMCWRAHSRSRGEHSIPSLLSSMGIGSSPLTRGARRRCPQRDPAPGLIPAHAGSTSTKNYRIVICRAHPRSRGEHSGYLILCLRILGSSPLTRGAQLGGSVRCSGIGLIPAHAGSTQAGWYPEAPLGAHPRSRGEHALGNLAQAPGRGSSPLTRGAR